MCYCETLKELSHVRACVCVCSSLCAVFVCLQVGFLVKGRECVRVMAHGYLQGQFYATFQLLPKFVFSSWSHCVYLQFIQDTNIYSAETKSACFCVCMCCFFFLIQEVALTLSTCTNKRNEFRPLCDISDWIAFWYSKALWYINSNSNCFCILMYTLWPGISLLASVLLLRELLMLQYTVIFIGALVNRLISKSLLQLSKILWQGFPGEWHFSRKLLPIDH